MERFFNTAGPQTEDAYTMDPLSRFDLDDILTFIRQKRYFVLHAPRQTGKTSCMLALRDYLNKGDDYICVYANVEGGQASRNDVQSVVKSTVDTLAREVRLVRGNSETDAVRDAVQSIGKDSMLSGHLIIFDRSGETSWEERIWHKPCQYQGHPIMVWGM